MLVNIIEDTCTDGKINALHIPKLTRRVQLCMSLSWSTLKNHQSTGTQQETDLIIDSDISRWWWITLFTK